MDILWTQLYPSDKREKGTNNNNNNKPSLKNSLGYLNMD